MSEPESGSDLASVRTKAVQVDGGWRITGTKVWTSGAHRADAFICLARSTPYDREHRHEGLSQFIVDLHDDRVTISPIISMNGEHHFNEVLLDEVFVSDEMVFGIVGNGWAQVTSELSYERSGPERFLSTYPLLAEVARQMGDDGLPASMDLGRLVGRVHSLHRMSEAVANALERRESANVAAAVVKVLGTTTEGDIAEFADLLTGSETSADPNFAELRDTALLQRPGFTLRGGSSEVLRSVIAKGLGLR